MLEDEHGYDVESVAHKGDRVEDMAYSGGQLEDFARTIEKLLRRSVVPKAILLRGVVGTRAPVTSINSTSATH